MKKLSFVIGLLLSLSAQAAPHLVGSTGAASVAPGTDLSSSNATATGGTTGRTLAASTADILSLRSFNVTCNGSTDDASKVQAAITAAVAAGGGIIRAYTGSICAIASTITVNNPNIVFSSFAEGDLRHSVGSQNGGATFKWTGSAGGTMFKFEAPAGASNQAITGNGMHGITLDCANSAAIGLQLIAANGGDYSGVFTQECTTAGTDLVPQSSLGDSVSTRQNFFRHLAFSTTLSTGVGVRVRGDGTTSNASFNTFIEINGIYKNGTGIELGNSDNNSFYDTWLFQASGGSGIGVDLTGDAGGVARANNFYHLSPGDGGVTLRGTELLTTATHDNNFFWYDKENAAPAIVLGTGVDAPIEFDNNSTTGRAKFPTLSIVGPRTLNAWTTNGVGLKAQSSTYNDGSSSGAVSLTAVHSLKAPTLTASSATTYADSATLYVEAPVASTNVTQTLASAIYTPGRIKALNGLIVSGNTVSLNVSSNSATNINTGNSNGNVTIGGGSNVVNFGSTTAINGDLSSTSWTTAGLGLKSVASTYTCTDCSGTVALQAAHAFAAPTFAASSATTYTDAATLYLAAPVAGSNVINTLGSALYAAGRIKGTNGLIITGNTVSLNASSNQVTNINTGTTNTALNLGGASATVGFFGATAVAQQAAATDLGTALSNLGLRASGTAYPITTSGAINLTGGLVFNGTDVAITDPQWSISSAGAAAFAGLTSTTAIHNGLVTVGSASAATGSTGEMAFAKITASGTAPGAGFAKEEWVCGTNAGTAKKIAYAGTSTTPVTIVDNVGSGVTGC